MVEDTLENLLTAKQLGMGTVLVGPRDTAEYVDVQIDHAVQMPEAMNFWSAA